MLGVRAYSVDDAGIVVHHWIGKTSIPFTAVEYARKDNLYCYVPRGAKNSRKSMTFMLHAENCGVEDSGKLFGAYFSVREGECIILRMKKGGSRIALTPESADEMLDDLKGCVASGGDVVFREGMSDASKSRLRKDQVAEIIGKINDDQIRLIEGFSDDILGRLGVDLDYRKGYVEGLKSLLSTVGVKGGEKEVYELDGFEKKMRL